MLQLSFNMYLQDLPLKVLIASGRKEGEMVAAEEMGFSPSTNKTLTQVVLVAS